MSVYIGASSVISCAFSKSTLSRSALPKFSAVTRGIGIARALPPRCTNTITGDHRAQRSPGQGDSQARQTWTLDTRQHEDGY